jgi:uncharacterized protein (TIGR02246 family)
VFAGAHVHRAQLLDAPQQNCYPVGRRVLTMHHARHALMPSIDRSAALIACAIVATLTACSADSMHTREQDEAAIRRIEQAYDRAWNAADVPALMALMAPAAVVVNPIGEVATGHVEIRRVLTEFLSGPAHGSTHASIIAAIHFVTEDVAIVDGEARLEGVRTSEPSPSSVVHRFTDVLVRTDGRWSIAQVRAYVFAPPG